MNAIVVIKSHHQFIFIISFSVIEMGIFGRRKAPAPDVIPVDPDEEKTRKMIEVASVIDQKIELSDKKYYLTEFVMYRVAALEVKRGTILDRAKIARKEKRDLGYHYS